MRYEDLNSVTDGYNVVHVVTVGDASTVMRYEDLNSIADG